MRLGVDLGGTKIEAVLLDAEGKIAMRKRVPTPRGSYEKTISSIKGLLNEIGRDEQPDLAVGIGIPGSISPASGLIKNANSTWLIGKPFDKDLEQATGRPVKLANDADCFALSEAADGAGAGSHSVFGVILGTGVGGGLVLNGKLLSGPNAIAGEWGHNPLPWPSEQERPGPKCYCGLSGCIETWVSGPGLEHDSMTNGFGTDRALEIAAYALEGNRDAIAVIDRYTHRLARALASVINVFDPETIVLGGGLSKIEQIYTAIPERWAEFIFSDSVATKLRPNLHGDSSGVRGAAWLWPEKSHTQGEQTQ
jgi:fructokinase